MCIRDRGAEKKLPIGHVGDCHNVKVSQIAAVFSVLAILRPAKEESGVIAAVRCV